MDKQQLAVMIPLLAVFFVGMIVLANSVLGQALARRIGGHRNLPDDVHQHLAEMHGELGALRQELAETQERLDFAERLLSRQAEADRLAPPA